MAKFHGPRFLFLVLAGLVLCKQGHTETSSNSSTQSTPTVTTTVSLASTQGTADDKNGPENSSASTSDSSRTSSTMNTISPTLTTSTTTENYMTGLPTSTPLHQHPNTTVTVTTAENMKASTSDSSRTSSTMNTISPPLTTSTTTDNDDTGTPARNSSHSNKTTAGAVTDNYTTGFPPSTTEHQHQSHTTSNERENMNTSTSDSARNSSTMNTTSPPPPLTPNTTTDNDDTGTPARNTSHSNKTTAGAVAEMNITGFPPSTTEHQHQSHTTSNERENYTTGLPTSTPLHQHQSQTTLKERVTDIYTTGLPTITTEHQHQSHTTLNATVADNNTTTLLPNTTKHQHSHATVTVTTAEIVSASTSDSSRTSSTMNTTPPPLTTSTTTDNNDTGTPARNTSHSNKTTAGAENMNTSTSDSARNSSTMNTTSPPPPLTPSTTTDNNDTGTPARNTSHSNKTTAGAVTDIYTTGLPTITTKHQHQSHTTLNTTVADNNTTTLLPNTTKHQHSHATVTVTTAEIVSASTSDSSRNSSTMNTTSPPLTTSTTTETSLKCSYTLEEENDTVTVKINKNDSAVKYKIKFTDTSDGSSTKTWPEESFPISLKSFKPCQNYNVTFDPPCNPMTGFFKTRELVDSDVSHTLNITGAKVQVCFETKWNLSECVDLNTSDSCTGYSVTFKGDPCKKSIPFTIPPVKPVINYTNEFPTKLRWDNQPSNCLKDLTYNCNGLTVADFEDLKPFHDYECTGTYDYESGTITSDPIRVKIDCDIVNEPSLSVSHNSIHASWQLDSQNCPSITTDFTWKVTCKNGSTSSLKGHCTKNSCEFSNLKSFTEYTCEFEAAYENKPFNTTTKTPKTWPGQPSFTKGPTKKEESHNAFKVSCSIDNWNGDPGKIFAELYINHNLQENKTDCNGKICDFLFTNLYYSTQYKIKVYAQNGHGNRTVILDMDHSTKYNDKAVIGFLAFLIVLTSVALLFVLYKIYLLKREKSSRNDQELDDLLPTNALLRVEPMSAEALLEAYKKKRADEGRLFMEEFQSVPRIFSNYSVREAKKPENQPKNRYVDILPYDYNRVTLSHGGTDYINASFIEGYKESNKYIAAQGPKEETVGDFWAMIWEQKTSIIVMVTRCEEGNKNKCAQYWPSMERETEIFEDLVVKIKGEENCPDYIIRHLTLMNRKEKAAEREVTHIQFTSWPDHGVPSDPGLLLKLRRRVNSFKNFFSGPIVVHCSAGVGRTGTYIGIDAMIESLEAEGRVDIYGYVVKLRRQRCLMVQVEAQYVLIHMALIEYSQFGETEMSLADFHSEVNTLRQKEGNETSLMDLEFQKLPKFRNYRASNTARTEENNKKNRSSIVPYDFNRVPIKVDDEASHDSEAEDEDEYSSDEEDEVPTKYINASYVDGYWCPSSFIVAQGPMPDTVADFLHMLYQKKVKTVFMLSDCTENDQEMCAQYWDDEKKTFGEMVVEVKETENFPTYIRRCLEIQHTKRKDSHTLQQYQFLKWVGHEIPPKPLDLVDMMKSARQSSVNSSKNNNLPIVAHCNDGSSRSGIFCALWKLLDSADTEKLVDIFQVAKDLRKARLGMINTLEQYEFLYAALEAAYPVQNGEVKKPSEAPADSVQIINESTALIPTNPSTDAEHQESTKEKPSEESTKEKPSEERTKEGTDSASPEEGVTESSSEIEKALSENTTNGPTATVEKTWGKTNDQL
ncbi:receptor-type tyrosine-protein phosphatase C isoform X11 [Ictalurus furcatus]|uniref:receptor-type tyrosine-protein phosphatase C isoform X11 n=1 Tax=Ictalurus furcatus TaxID=66913 RepID=UPI002350B3A6|nr:receptor-type tyrosine-protein phosphatase C isoform X11 [Ictalurus furcatus]